MKKILIQPKADRDATAFYMGPSLLNKAFLKNYFRHLKGKKVILTDTTVKELYGSALAKAIDAEMIVIAPGEKTKSQKSAQGILDELFKLGMGRDTTLIALGGGVITDLGGFVASIYMRGIPLVLIPTTLLGMVDASIGGKTAIDTSYGKNLIGTIYPPKAIFADLRTLETLPPAERFNGLAEILKMGLIYDPEIWMFAVENTKAMIFEAAEAKIQIIKKDPMEKGLRRILNFGHTIGHALEKISDYELPHGVAVAMGCSIEAHLSLHLGYLPVEDFCLIQAVYSQFAFKLPSKYTRQRFLQAMSHDKKKERDEVRFVCINRIGHAMGFKGAYCRPVSFEELKPTLEWMEEVIR